MRSGGGFGLSCTGATRPAASSTGLSGNSEAVWPSSPIPSSDDVEHDVGELALVGARGGLGAELALHAVRDRAGRRRASRARGARWTRVVRADAALVGEPEVDAAPVGHERPEQRVGRARRGPAGERDVGGAALRERLADRGGEQLGGAPGGGAGVRLALDDDAGAQRRSLARKSSPCMPGAARPCRATASRRASPPRRRSASSPR